jgi:aspartate racemase
MKTIGLIGGMSWESTRLYYDALNVLVRDRLGGLHSAKIILHSVDFAPIAEMQYAGQWDEMGLILADAALGLERAGADCIGLATNTMHKVAHHITRACQRPFIHIADATADALVTAGRERPLLLATRFTMEQDFYKGILTARGLEVSVPDDQGRVDVNTIIYDELCRGIINPTSRARYEALTADAQRMGCDSVILGCTEVGMLLGADNAALPIFDTTHIHAKALVDFALTEVPSPRSAPTRTGREPGATVPTHGG